MVIDKKPISFNNFSTQGLEYGFSKIGPDPKKVQYYLKKGASLVLNDIIYYSKNIKNLAIDLQEITNGKCQANLYFSMQNRQAFGPHFDTHDVFALHCDGEKTWNIYETLADNPINQFTFKPSLEERTKAVENNRSSLYEASVIFYTYQEVNTMMLLHQKAVQFTLLSELFMSSQ